MNEINEGWPSVDSGLSKKRKSMTRAHGGWANPLSARRRVRMAIRFALSAILLLSSVSGCGDRNTSAKTGSQGLSLDRIVANGNSYVVARIDLRCAKLSLAWKDSKGNGYRSFDSLIRSRPHLVEFATNAGIFDPTHTPCGWHVEDGKVLISLNVGEGEGNFYLKPNGVFLIDDKGARVLATQDAARLNNVSVATQSGPLLLQGGRIPLTRRSGAGWGFFRLRRFVSSSLNSRSAFTTSLLSLKTTSAARTRCIWMARSPSFMLPSLA
jgi:hypothetical protein